MRPEPAAPVAPCPVPWHPARAPGTDPVARAGTVVPVGVHADPVRGHRVAGTAPVVAALPVTSPPMSLVMRPAARLEAAAMALEVTAAAALEMAVILCHCRGHAEEQRSCQHGRRSKTVPDSCDVFHALLTTRLGPLLPAFVRAWLEGRTSGCTS